MIANTVIDMIYANFGHLLRDMNQPCLSQQVVKSMQKLSIQRGQPLTTARALSIEPSGQFVGQVGSKGLSTMGTKEHMPLTSNLL